MAIPAKDLIHWLNSLPLNANVGVDDGGLTLQVIDNPQTYIEVGGIPTDEEDVDDDNEEYKTNDAYMAWKTQRKNGETTLSYREWVRKIADE